MALSKSYKCPCQSKDLYKGTDDTQSLPGEWAISFLVFIPCGIYSEGVGPEQQSQYEEQTATLGAALNDSLNHSCENLTFPLQEAAQVRRPDDTTLFRDRKDLTVLPTTSITTWQQDKTFWRLPTPSCHYMKRRYFWTMIKWCRRGFGWL